MGSPFSSPAPSSPIQRAALGVLAVVLVGSAGYGAFAYHTSHPSLAHHSLGSGAIKDQAGGSASTPSLTQAQSAALTAMPSPTASPYANWTTERGTSLSIKRPQTWFGAKDMGLSNQGDALTFASEKGKYPFKLTDKGIYVATGVLPISGADIYNEVFASPLGRVTLQGSFDPNNVYTKLAVLTLAGYPAVEYSVDYSDNPQGQLNLNVVYVIKKGAEYYSITFSINKAQLTSDTGLIKSIAESLTFSN